MAQSKPAYQLFNEKGKRVKYKKLLKKAAKADVILFGEFHNNPISHWLQLELAKDLTDKEQTIIYGAEMFETDGQEALSQYLADEVDLETWESQKELWPNLKTDYLPLVDFAKAEKRPFIATNIPRRFARMVYKGGGFEVLDTLSEQDKSLVAPLPIAFDVTLPGYAEMYEMAGGHASGINFPKAQAVKDATMAHFILKHWVEGAIFYHLNGAFHSDRFDGIYWYLKQANPELNILTITTVQQTQVKKLDQDQKNRANFIIVVPETMTKTY